MESQEYYSSAYQLNFAAEEQALLQALTAALLNAYSLQSLVTHGNVLTSGDPLVARRAQQVIEAIESLQHACAGSRAERV